MGKTSYFDFRAVQKRVNLVNIENAKNEILVTYVAINQLGYNPERTFQTFGNQPTPDPSLGQVNIYVDGVSVLVDVLHLAQWIHCTVSRIFSRIRSEIK